jgi:hypothetical protein
MASQLNFRETVGTLTEITRAKTCQTKGTINQITLHFPSGCNALVDVAVFKNSQQLVPDTGFISLNDATPQFFTDKPIDVGDEVTVKFVNADSTWPHTISVVVGII